MHREVPFDVQYLILAEVSRVPDSDYAIPKPTWAHIVNCLCVCRAWNSWLRDLLVCNIPASSLLQASEAVGQFAMEKATAYFTARQALGNRSSPPAALARTVCSAHTSSLSALYHDPLIYDLEKCMLMASEEGYMGCLRVGFDAQLHMALSLCKPTDLLSAAIQKGQLDAVKLVYERVDWGDVEEQIGALNFTLTDAVEHSKLGIVDWALEKGADRDVTIWHWLTDDEYPFNLVSYADYLGDKEMMAVFEKHGMSVDDIDRGWVEHLDEEW